ncbi:hypothetical protein G7Y31_02210 [Corynebacterium lizhenjunii]|uniref:DUF2273 domain-containing protein n=1 Tax=Corynebacterium lizhenjunii TaxID=2709394 RepID=A0A7T0PAX2_9CORY|nr:hypothetical protein [Corynebacterium lizhenjunii]QPK79546.1 hypothetical protein G7Y31_02210 [Corynebacterium lizhenjunii]
MNSYKYTAIGAIGGLLAAIAIFFGWWPLFLLMIIFVGGGALIGAHYDGKLDLVDLFYGLINRPRG